MVAHATIETLLIPSCTIYPKPCPNEISWSYALKKLAYSPQFRRRSGRRRQRTPGPGGAMDSWAPCWPWRCNGHRKLASRALRAECCTSSWWCRRDLGDDSSERQGAQLSTEPSGPGVRWRLWPLLRQHCGEEASFLKGVAPRDFIWKRRGIDSATRNEKSYNCSTCYHVLEFLLRSWKCRRPPKPCAVCRTTARNNI